MPIASYFLSIHQLQYMVALGYEKEERALPQRVEFEIDFRFGAVPANEDDFLCYDGLATHLANHLRAAEFRLIETLAFNVLEEVRVYARSVLPTLPDDALAIRLRARKCHVPVEWIKDGATVTVTDGSPESIAWP